MNVTLHQINIDPAKYGPAGSEDYFPPAMGGTVYVVNNNVKRSHMNSILIWRIYENMRYSYHAHIQHGHYDICYEYAICSYYVYLYCIKCTRIYYIWYIYHACIKSYEYEYNTHIYIYTCDYICVFAWKKHNPNKCLR